MYIIDTRDCDHESYSWRDVTCLTRIAAALREPLRIEASKEQTRRETIKNRHRRLRKKVRLPCVVRRWFVFWTVSLWRLGGLECIQANVILIMSDETRRYFVFYSAQTWRNLMLFSAYIQIWKLNGSLQWLSKQVEFLIQSLQISFLELVLDYFS